MLTLLPALKCAASCVAGGSAQTLSSHQQIALQKHYRPHNNEDIGTI
jgi:hypothetical protein